MCGWPFVRSARAMQAIAAPVPSPPRYAGLPRYCSEFLVRADERLDARSRRPSATASAGWRPTRSRASTRRARTSRRSRRRSGRRSYAEVRGPLGTPATTLEALRAGEVDVVALDGFYLDLCRRHQPARLAGIATASRRTPWTPIPLLVAAPGVEPDVVDALRAQLVGAAPRCRRYAPLLADVLLERFVAPDLPAYAQLEAMAAYAIERGYPTIR